METPDGQPVDYPLEQNEAGDMLPGRLDEPKTTFEDAWDPTGYYRRKAERNAEMEPYLAWIFVAGIVMIVVVLLKEIAMITTAVLVGTGLGLFIGWATPQPKFAQKGEDWIRAKMGLQPKQTR